MIEVWQSEHLASLVDSATSIAIPTYTSLTSKMLKTALSSAPSTSRAATRSLKSLRSPHAVASCSTPAVRSFSSTSSTHFATVTDAPQQKPKQRVYGGLRDQDRIFSNVSAEGVLPLSCETPSMARS